MRVWLVDEQPSESTPSLEPMLRQLTERAAGRMVLLGCGPLRPGLLTELRGWQLDLLVIRDACWPSGPEAQHLLDLDVGVVVVADEDRCEPFVSLADEYPLGLVAPPARPGDLWPALLTTLAARRRYVNARDERLRLQQRLNDRIAIERAKGILVQRLGITEDEAYKRMRVISRRHRRPIRDIAQSLLDTESLLLSEVNGFCEAPQLEIRKPPAV